MGKQIVMIAAGFLLILGTACRRENRVRGDAPTNAKTSQVSAVIPKARIITKDPELNRLLHPSTTEDDILSYSKSYLQKKQEIEAKLASINDPELRARLASDEWSKVDKSAFISEGKSNLRASLSAEMRAFLDRHRADWFEIGHVEYPGSGSLNVESVEASPLELPEGATIALDIPTMDGVYSKFREVASKEIQTNVDHWMYEQTCAAHLKNACQNLGGSAEECSNPEKLQEISEQLAGGGILIGCDDHPSAKVGQQTVEQQMRKNRLVLVAKGDLLMHRIDKLLLVDYDTEDILFQFPPSALTGKVVWKFPSESQRTKEGAANYRTLASTDSLRDFGVVPIHGDSDTVTFQMQNDSDNPKAIAVSLQGDDADAFVLHNDCDSGIVEPGDACKFTVYFSPAHLGLQTSTILIVGEGWKINSIVLRGYGTWQWDMSGN